MKVPISWADPRIWCQNNHIGGHSFLDLVLEHHCKSNGPKAFGQVECVSLSWARALVWSGVLICLLHVKVGHKLIKGKDCSLFYIMQTKVSNFWKTLWKTNVLLGVSLKTCSFTIFFYMLHMNCHYSPRHHACLSHLSLTITFGSNGHRLFLQHWSPICVNLWVTVKFEIEDCPVYGSNCKQHHQEATLKSKNMKPREGTKTGNTRGRHTTSNLAAT